MNFVSQTSKVVMNIFDNYVEEEDKLRSVEKYLTKIERGNRLRGNSSLRSPGFTFPEVDVQFQEIEFSHEKEGYPVLKDGKYSLGYQKNLLKSERSVREVFNAESWSSPSEAPYRHRMEFPVDLEYVEVVTYQRHPDGLKKHLYEEVAELSPIPGSTEYLVGGVYNFSELRKDKYEFTVDIYSGQEIALNQVETFENLADTSSPIDTEQTSVLGYSEPLDNKVFFEHFPLSTEQIFTMVGADLIQWERTTSFGTSTDRNYLLYEKEGLAILNPNHEPDKVWYGYRTLPSVNYYLKNSQKYYEGGEVDLGRAIEKTKQGSFLLCLARERKELLDLKFDLDSANLVAGTIESFYYNQPFQKIQITVINKENQEPVPSVELRIENINKIGTVKNKKIFTDEEGIAEFWYKPPTLSQSFIWAESVDSTSVSNPLFEYLGTDHDETYVFGVWKDDPLMGSTSVNEDGVAWNKKNGRKVLVYEWNSQVWNPVTNTQGAFSPLRPSDLEGDVLTFDSALPSFDPDDNDQKVGGLAIAGELESLLSITYENHVYELRIKNKFYDQQKGNIEYLGKEYPMGFKLYSENLDVSNTLGGPVYLTVNPFTSEYTILFEGTQYLTISNTIDLGYNII